MIIWCLLSLILLAVCLNDFLLFRIQNEHIVWMCGLYVVSCIFGVSGHNIVLAMCFAISSCTAAFFMNKKKLIGGGDVKLLFPLIIFAENDLYLFWTGVCIGSFVIAMLYIGFSNDIVQIRTKMFKKISQFAIKTPILNTILLNFNKIKKVDSSFAKVVDPFKQDVPYAIPLSTGMFFVIFERLFLGC